MIQTSIAERLQQLCSALGEKPKEFACDRLGYDRPQKFYNWLHGEFKPKKEAIDLIVAKTPGLNRSWLVRGQGPMFVGSGAVVEPPPIADPAPGGVPLTPISEEDPLIIEVRQLREEIERKDKQIKNLKEALQRTVAVINFKGVGNGASGSDLTVSPTKAKRALLWALPQIGGSDD